MKDKNKFFRHKRISRYYCVECPAVGWTPLWQRWDWAWWVWVKPGSLHSAQHNHFIKHWSLKLYRSILKQHEMYLLQSVDDRNEKTNIRDTFMIKVPHPFHQLRRWRHCGQETQSLWHQIISYYTNKFTHTEAHCTFIREYVQTAGDQCLCSFRTVLYQEQQVWRAHSHSSYLQKTKSYHLGWHYI